MRLCVYFISLFLLTNCNLPRQEGPFVAPSEFEPTITPNWAATIEAAPTLTETAVPEPTIEVEQPTETPTATVEIEPTPTLSPTVAITPAPVPVNTGPILYYTQSGDTLDALAVRFGVTVDEIDTTGTLPDRGFIYR